MEEYTVRISFNFLDRETLKLIPLTEEIVCSATDEDNAVDIAKRRICSEYGMVQFCVIGIIGFTWGY